jgi:site-specific recombinase XerD
LNKANRREYFKRLFEGYNKGYGLKEVTIKRKIRIVERFYEFIGKMDILEVRDKDVLSYIYEISRNVNKDRQLLSEKTISNYISGIKDFFSFLYKSEYILTNPAEELSEVKLGRKKNIREVFSCEEMNKFLDSIPVIDSNSQRNRAIFELMYSSGLRRGEVLKLLFEDVDFNSRTILVRCGKGGKDRYVPFSRLSLKFLVKYANEGRKEHIENITNENIKKYFFLGYNKAISGGMLSDIFRKYLKEVNLEKRGFTLHSIRHSTATHLIQGGADVRYVRELLGHEDINTTQIYLQPGIENVKKIYMTYHARENEYYDEVDAEYLTHIKELKRRLREGKIMNKKYNKKLKNY